MLTAELIAGLEKERDQAKADLQTAQSTIVALNADLDASRKTATEGAELLANAKVTIETLEGSLKISAEKVATLEAKVAVLEATAKSADQLATEKAAAAGVIPTAKTGVPISGNSTKCLTRAEFNALKADEKSAFCLTGGIITD